MKVAVIPARGGSKRIPRKNIKYFYGQPMIAYAISAAIRSNLFDKIIVSTDDIKISEIAINCGAECPFIRPSELADDHTSTVEVISHAITELEKQGWLPKWVCCIYPAVPFIEVTDLVNAFNLLQESRAEYAFPIAEFPSPIQRAIFCDEDGYLSSKNCEYELTRTQDLEPSFYDAGQFYWGASRAWTSNKSIHNNAIGLKIPHWRAVDIDTQDDWIRAENYYRAINCSG